MNTFFNKAYSYQRIFNFKNSTLENKMGNDKRIKAIISNIIAVIYKLISFNIYTGTNKLSFYNLKEYLYDLAMQSYLKQDHTLEEKWNEEIWKFSFSNPNRYNFTDTPFHYKFTSVCVCVCVWLSHVWLCDPMDCRPPGSSVVCLRERILEWVATSSSRDLPDPGAKIVSPESPALAGGFLTTEPRGKPL